MLCPQCETPAPGGTACPFCGNTVPERETFSGQGGHYLWVLAVLSLTLFILLLVLSAFRVGLAQAWPHLVGSSWFWVYAVLCLAPLTIGIYYWFLLRDEETIVTDAYIERRSHWGSERVNWEQANGFYRQILPFRQTRLGRISGLSRVLVDSRLIARFPPYAYRITTLQDSIDNQSALTIEPGTVDDLAWLVKLIGERLGPPQVL